jgi:hypothetical protein
LPTSYEAFRTLSDLGKELVELHLLKHPALGHAEVGYPSEGSDKVDFVRFNESAKKFLSTSNNTLMASLRRFGNIA